MGRIDVDATPHQGGVDQFHQSNLSSFAPTEVGADGAPPPIEDDLYEPPRNYHPPNPSTINRSTPPQQFPPPRNPHPDIHHFPPSQDPHPDVHHFPHPQDHHPDVHHFPPPSPVHHFPPPSPQDLHTAAVHQFPPLYDKPPPQQQMGHLYTPPPQQQTGYSGNQYQPQQPNVQNGIPVGLQQNQLPTQSWSSDLFDCMKNPQNAIITLFFPCVTFGQIAEILDSGSTSCGTSGMLYSLILCCIAMPCIMSCTYRTKLRSKYGLVESPAPDWVIHCFCEYCALCQEYRELEERGFDPSIGWLGNVAKQQQKQQQFGMTPPMQQRMF